MRILLAELAPPFPPSNGHRLRNWGLMRALVDEGHTLDLVSFADPADLQHDLTPLRSLCASVRWVPAPPAQAGWRQALARLRHARSSRPYGTFRYCSPAMQQAIRQALADARVDVVLCDDIYMYLNLPESARPPLLLNKDDLTFVILRRMLARMRNPLKRAYAWLECRKLRRWETLVTSHSAAVLVCSEEDRRLLQALVPGVAMPVAPNAIDVESYVPCPGDDGHTALYCGAMDYHANQDAVEFFVAQILPALQRLAPEVKFRVAGRHPPDWLRQSCAGKAEFSGAVPDMRAEIAPAAVCVVPLRIGSGTRLKILEAAAMAKPIVSTRIGAEGLDFVDGEEIILADDPQEFAQAVAGFLADPARRHRLGAAARQRVARQYGLPALRAALRSAIEKLVVDSRKPCPQVA